MNIYLPYIVSVICAAIAGFASYAVARKQAKADIERLIKQHELDIEKERARRFLLLAHNCAISRFQ